MNQYEEWEVCNRCTYKAESSNRFIVSVFVIVVLGLLDTSVNVEGRRNERIYLRMLCMKSEDKDRKRSTFLFYYDRIKVGEGIESSPINLSKIECEKKIHDYIGIGTMVFYFR